MVVIQIILIIGFCALLLRFLTSPSGSKTRAWKKIFGMLFTVLAIILILSPQTANHIAHLVGVGRGADLLLYILTLAFIFLCIHLYIKSKQDEQRLVALARKITLLEAQLHNSSRTKRK